METLIINIPEKKNVILKHILKELGVIFQKASQSKKETF
ncbi:hypothetical protein ADIARSV_1681 [Arcticibacter svalbardensis MN12-7]|uniref:Uncharacterized protein n=1 Tax=Arcticibacter svalbardensis MN12-7 TaxID=1150600 RepID=R9GU57_9SPHI|nr:hypothetical protein ADIARSV_1681 [Arcticibacter svalbardensis MN12-7]